MDIESIEARITKCEEDIKISTTVQIRPMSIRQNHRKLDNMLYELGRVRESIESLKSKPGKRWESLIIAIIGALAGAFIAYILR